MRIVLRFVPAGVLTFMLLVAGLGAAPAGHQGDAAQAAAAELRDRYYGRDFEGAYWNGQQLVARFPDSVELRAWWVTAASRADHEAEALDAARALVQSHPDNPWSWFALAAASRNDSENEHQALEASAKALELLPDDADALWMRAQTLTVFDAFDDAVALIDERVGELDNPAELLAAKAYVFYRQSFGRDGRDEEKIQAALAGYEQARRADPSNVNAHFFPGSMLASMRRTEEALPLLAEAARLSPRATSIRSTYWRAIAGSRELSAEEKRARVEADSADLLDRTEGDPVSHAQALQAVKNAYEQLNLEDQRFAVEERILALYPDSLEAEWVHVDRYRALREQAGREGFTDPVAQREYRRLLREFIRRPEHHRMTLKGDAYRSLYYELSEDEAPDPAELLEVVWGMVEWEGINPHVVFAGGAITLAEKTDYYRAAEAIARMGFDEARKKIESQRSFYDTEGDYDNAMKWYVGMMHDALGWVFYQEGRLEEAEKELMAAYDMNPKDRKNLYHLGQLAEAQDDVGKAESFYIQGLAVQQPGDNPSRTALEELYAAEHDDLEGFDDYLAEIREAEAADRRAEILSERIDDPQAAPVFELEDLAGASHTLADYRGKIVVVNFWGIWCGWCVIEMPDLQTLHATFADDPEVTLITINNDRNPDDVPAWMQEEGYDFPVLLDDGYVAGAAGVSVFPTTWVLDRAGRIAFLKEGWSQELIEEFTWRIESLRQR